MRRPNDLSNDVHAPKYRNPGKIKTPRSIQEMTSSESCCHHVRTVQLHQGARKHVEAMAQCVVCFSDMN